MAESKWWDDKDKLPAWLNGHMWHQIQGDERRRGTCKQRERERSAPYCFMQNILGPGPASPTLQSRDRQENTNQTSHAVHNCMHVTC
jgi:hypothetical protein